jgi:hypothetical protein
LTVIQRVMIAIHLVQTFMAEPSPPRGLRARLRREKLAVMDNHSPLLTLGIADNVFHFRLEMDLVPSCINGKP